MHTTRIEQWAGRENDLPKRVLYLQRAASEGPPCVLCVLCVVVDFPQSRGVMYLQRGPPIAENNSTTHRTHRTHRGPLQKACRGNATYVRPQLLPSTAEYKLFEIHHTSSVDLCVLCVVGLFLPAVMSTL
jgi:hypothetical protein